MEKVFDKIYETKQNGLYLINTPTGSAKSYTAVQFMKKHCKDLKENQHFIFITNNKNNLAIDELKKAFGEEYDQYVLRVESLLDNILHNFDKAKIPEYVKELPSCKSLNRNIFIYNEVKKEVENRQKFCLKHDNSYGSSIMLENTVNQLKNVEEQLRTAEENFRKELRKMLKIALGDCASKVEKKKIIKTKYAWVKALYPAMFAEEYPILCMTVKKFFASNDPIYTNTYSFASVDWLDGSYLFIDEIDSTKSEINSIILDNSMKSTVELIQMVSRCITGVLDLEHSLCRELQQIILQKPKQFEKIRKEAQQIRDKYRDELAYYCGDIKTRNFLMSDSSFHACYEEQSKDKAYAYYDENEKHMRIRVVKSKDEITNCTEEKYNLFTIIRAMNHFLLLYKLFFDYVGEQCAINKNKVSTSSDYTSIEDGIESVYGALRLVKEDIIYFKNNIKLGSRIALKQVDKNLRKTNIYYDRGIRMYEFANNANNLFNTSFSYMYVSQSAELLLVELARRLKVIGLSATSRIDSVLSNYNLSYLKSRLGNHFYTLDEEDFQRIKDEYALLNKKYTNQEIEVCIEKMDECFYDEQGKILSVNDMIDFVYKERKHQKFAYKLFEENKLIYDGKEESYIIARYLTMVKVYQYFISHAEIKSFLCLNNALPAINNPNFKLDVLKKLFEISCDEWSVDYKTIGFVVLRSGVSFDYDKEDLLTRLANGEKIFVMSAYATFGAGQNIAYNIPEQVKNELVNLTDFANPNDGRNYKKDFDGIYLGDITHAVTNLYDKSLNFDKEMLADYLIELENLYANDEISYVQKHKGILDGFEKYKYSFYSPKLSFNECRSVFLYKSSKIIQAVGRLSRSFNKNKKIHILICKKIENNFDPSLREQEILSPEMEQLANYIANHVTKIAHDNCIENRANRISTEGKSFIYELLSGEWNEEKIRVYKEKLGETILKYPTASLADAQKNTVINEFYIQGKSPLKHYYFMEYGDFNEVEVFLNQTKAEAIVRKNSKNDKEYELWVSESIREVSEENARLDKVLNYPGMREYFEKHGYATCFEKNDVIISPVLFQNIYKGRLGEVVGKFVIEQELNIQLEELETEIYERFDFKVKDIYIDFKHWRMSRFNDQMMKEKITNKLHDVNGRKALIINLFDDNETHRIIESNAIIEIPALLSDDGTHVNYEAIKKIKDVLEVEVNDTNK